MGPDGVARALVVAAVVMDAGTRLVADGLVVAENVAPKLVKLTAFPRWSTREGLEQQSDVVSQQQKFPFPQGRRP